MRATGASPLQTFVYGVIPQAMPLVASYSLYLFEHNIRAASILGIVGAGGVGFVISHEHDLIIGTAVIEQWRTKFPAIPDLEAQMQKLSAYILKGGLTHPGWRCPEGWMAGCLSDDNQKALESARIANARVAKFGAKRPVSRW